ncbi:hypothetical protein IFR05_015962 [Cadophora sp. M221]|nr:hypothetical protein IFR05_015962 [Cadophora sp. M221]
MSSRTPLNPECVHCSGKASLVCSACAEAIEFDMIPTWYCTTECQKKDLENHKPYCDFIQDRNSVFKAVSVIHEVFREVRDTLVAVSSVEMSNGKWAIYHRGNFAGLISLPEMVNLPSGMTTAEVNIEKVKLYGCSLHAGLWANSLIKNILIRRGIASKVTPLWSVTSQSDWGSTVGVAVGTSPKMVEVTHIILKVEMANISSEEFAVDFYGHTLGNAKAVTPMTKYFSEHVPVTMSNDGNTYFGFWREYAMALGQKEKSTFIMYIDNIFTDTIVEDLRVGLRSWEAKEKTTLKDLLRRPAAEIEREKQALGKSIYEACVDSLIDRGKKRAAARAAVLASDSDDDEPDLLMEGKRETN